MASFHCKTSSHLAFWIINGEFVPESHWLSYGHEFQFDDARFSSREPHFYNLSLIVTGSSQTNLTTFACKAYVDDVSSVSEAATLYVFNNSGKLNKYSETS